MNTLKIKDIAKQIRGVSYKPEDLRETLDDTSVILLRANNIYNGKINFKDVVYVDISRVSQEQYLRKGDVLICTSSGSKELVGKAASFEFDIKCTFGAFCKVVRPRTEYAKYIGKFFQSSIYRKKIADLSIGANINNIRNEHIDALRLKIYDFNTNKKIVSEISKLQKLIELRRREVEKLDYLVQARFVEMFGDPITNEKKFLCKDGKSLFAFSSGKFLDESRRMAEGVPVYGGNGIAWYTDNALIEKPTVVIGRVGAYCGNVRMVTEAAWITDNAIYIKELKTNDFNLNFLYELMQYMNFARFADYSGQPKITQKPLETLDYIVPPINLQNQFAAFVAQTDKSKAVIQKSIDELQILFDSLMQKYFG